MIVLFNPRSAKWKHRLPLSLLALGAVLEGKFPYEIVDGNTEADVEAALTQRIRNSKTKYLGVTVMPGPQLVQAITVSRSLKARFPDLIIVWGGYFPSLHPDVVLASGFVDYVVQGQGEWSFLRLIQVLEKGEVPERLQFSSGPLTDIDAVPPIPYERMNVQRYIGKTCLGSRTLSYHSSFGCPFLCGFCAVAGIYKGMWIGRSAVKVAEDVLWLRDKYNVNAVEFVDNNFFVAEKRTRELSELLKGSGIGWWGEARPDTLMKYSDQTWQAMRDSGCRMIFFGVESSSNTVLALMEKGGTQTSDLVLDLAERAGKFGIIPEFSFVFGVPSENVDEQIERDIQYIRRIKQINAASEIVIYVYSPVSFDDAALLKRAKGYGFEFPRQLTDWLKPPWMNFDLRKNPRTPWLEQRHIDRIMNFERVLNAKYPTVSDIRLKTWQTRILQTLGGWRYRWGVYALPYEIRFVANRLFKYRQPEIEGF